VDRGLRRRAKGAEGVVEVRYGLYSRVGGLATRLTIVLQVGARGCGPPFYADKLIRGGQQVASGVRAV
jgi:hypothetical protein